MKSKIFAAVGAMGVAIVTLPLFAAFEAHVVNVTAKIENALYVHPQSIQFGTVFPQEYFESDFFIAFSESFSETSQTRVGKVDYVIKQKPKPREAFLAQVGVEAARDWCHTNIPDPLYRGYATSTPAWDAFFVNCYPTLCPYLSKHEVTPDGKEIENDVSLDAFHNPETAFASGKIVKFHNPNNTIGRDSSDSWVVDLAVPCFAGHCAQDWADFVHGKNPNANPDLFMLPPDLEHEVIACDLWVEVTKIY